MTPDDPLRLPLLLAALAAVFALIFGAGSYLAAWGLRWKRRAERAEAGWRLAVSREARHIERRAMAQGKRAADLERRL